MSSLLTSTGQCVLQGTQEAEEQSPLFTCSLQVLRILVTETPSRSQSQIQGASGQFQRASTSRLLQCPQLSGAEMSSYIHNKSLSGPEILSYFWDYSHLISKCGSKLAMAKPHRSVFKAPVVTSKYTQYFKTPSVNYI